MTIEISIRKPPSASYPALYNWMPLKVERIDFDVNNDLSTSALTNDENKVVDVVAATIQLLVTGVMSGSSATAEMWKLVTCAREWKFASGLSQANILTNAQVKWRNREEYMMIHRLTFVETAETDAGSLEYLLTLAIRTQPRT